MNKCFIITNFKCNLNCVYCNVNDLYKDTLNIEHIKDIITTLKELNFKEIHLIGGEPFLRKDILEILKFIKEKDMLVIVHTNAFYYKKLTDEILCYIDIFHSCLNGSKEIHNKIRGKKTFENLMESLNIINKYNLKNDKQIKIYLDTILTDLNSNIENINFILEFVKNNNYKVNFQKVFDHKLVNVDNGYLQNNVNDKNMIFNYLLSVYDDTIFLNSLEYIKLNSIEETIKLKKCNNQTLIINPNGNVSYCFDKINKNNLNGLKNGWSYSIIETMNIKNDCTICPYSSHVEDSLNVK